MKYLTLILVAQYLAQGWKLEDDFADCHHGRHAVLMIWEGENEPA